MLQLHEISKRIGSRELFRRASVAVHPREVVAVIGPNGSGKSTLLAIAAGSSPPDEGVVSLDAGARIEWLRQSFEAPVDATAGECFPALFPEAAPSRLEVVAGLIASGAGGHREAALLEEYERLLDIVADPDGARRAAGALEGLGVTHVDPGTPVQRLSGGEQAKLALARALTSGADVLLLDEPTNHLDLPGIRWLEDALATFEGAVLLVSHDRELLDRLAGRLLVLSAEGGVPEVFTGGYSAWIEERDRRAEEQWAAYGRQQRDDRRLREHLAQLESRSRYIENSTINFAIRKKAKKIARRSTTLKRRLQREAQGDRRIERPREGPGGIQAAFSATERSASRLVEFRDATLAVAGRTLLRDVDLTLGRGDRVALVGANGSGKSTLLRAVLGQAAPPSGEVEAVEVDSGEVFVAASARIGYLAQEDALDGREHLTPIDLVRSEGRRDAVEAGNFVHRVLPGHEQASTPLGRLSYGERRRLALALLMLQHPNVLLLDEPTNHLDVESQEAVEAALDGYEGAALAVTHDRRLIGAIAERVWSVEELRIIERTPEEIVDR